MDVSAQHVDRPHRRYLGRVLRHRRSRSASGRASAARRPQTRTSSPPSSTRSPSSTRCPGRRCSPHSCGDVHVAVGQVGGLGQRGEQLRVLAGGGIADVPGGIAAEPPPEPGGHGPRLVEPVSPSAARRTAAPLPRRTGPRRSPARGRRSPRTASQITQAQQRVRALRRTVAQRACRPVHIARPREPACRHLRTCLAVSWRLGPCGGTGAVGRADGLLLIRRAATAPLSYRDGVPGPIARTALPAGVGPARGGGNARVQHPGCR